MLNYIYPLSSSPQSVTVRTICLEVPHVGIDVDGRTSLQAVHGGADGEKGACDWLIGKTSHHVADSLPVPR